MKYLITQKIRTIFFMIPIFLIVISIVACTKIPETNVSYLQVSLVNTSTGTNQKHEEIFNFEIFITNTSNSEIFIDSIKPILGDTSLSETIKVNRSVEANSTINIKGSMNTYNKNFRFSGVKILSEKIFNL